MFEHKLPNANAWGVSEYQRQQFCRRWFLGPRCDDDLFPIYDESFEDSSAILHSYLRYGLSP